MSLQQTKHLNDDNILWTLITPDMLQANEKQHFQACPVCRDKQTSLLQELNEINIRSREYLPKPKRNLRPVTIEKSASPVFYRMKHGLVYACMVMICVGGVFGLWPTQKKSPINSVAIEQTQKNIAELLQTMDTNQQTNNDSILPVTFQYIVPDEFEIMSEPFYDYVFPISTQEINDS